MQHTENKPYMIRMLLNGIKGKQHKFGTERGLLLLRSAFMCQDFSSLQAALEHPAG